MSHTPLMRQLRESTIKSAIDVVAKIRTDMLASPVDDISVISRPQLEVIEAALRLSTAISKSSISADPDLFEALAKLVEDLEMRSVKGVVDCSDGVYQRALAAISKAQGKRDE